MTRRLEHDDFELVVYDGLEPLDPVDANVDVEVELQADRTRWSATFFTLQNLDTLMRRHEATGECDSGRYCWSSAMIVVRELTTESIVATVESLLRQGEFTTAFDRIDDGAREPAAILVMDRGRAIEMLDHLESIVVSLDRIGSCWEDLSKEEFDRISSEFLDDWNVARTLAGVRRTLSELFTSDELEAMDEVPHWAFDRRRPR